MNGSSVGTSKLNDTLGVKSPFFRFPVGGTITEVCLFSFLSFLLELLLIIFASWHLLASTMSIVWLCAFLVASCAFRVIAALLLPEPLSSLGWRSLPSCPGSLRQGFQCRGRKTAVG